MSTHSLIGVIHEDGKIESQYCHYDGYPTWNGKLLLQYFNTYEKAIKLLEGFPIRGLQQDGGIDFFTDEDKNLDEYRSLKEFEKEFKNDIGYEYAYIFDCKSKSWLVYDESGKYNLIEVLTNEK